VAVESGIKVIAVTTSTCIVEIDGLLCNDASVVDTLNIPDDASADDTVETDGDIMVAVLNNSIESRPVDEFQFRRDGGAVLDKVNPSGEVRSTRYSDSDENSDGNDDALEKDVDSSSDKEDEIVTDGARVELKTPLDSLPDAEVEPVRDETVSERFEFSLESTDDRKVTNAIIRVAVEFNIPVESSTDETVEIGVSCVVVVLSNSSVVSSVEEMSKSLGDDDMSEKFGMMKLELTSAGPDTDENDGTIVV
jgi:hypothetical protein